MQNANANAMWCDVLEWKKFVQNKSKQQDDDTRFRIYKTEHRIERKQKRAADNK